MRSRMALVLALGLACGGQAASGDLRVQGQLISESTSDPPLAVSSSQVVSDLNADRLDGFDVGDFAIKGSGVGVHWKNLVEVPGEEIDQDCAVNTGCFTGDTAGFPVSITEPGSYRLAGNLDVSGETDPENASAILIDSPDVSLDLRGFHIQGPVSCSDTPVTGCSHASGDGDGILVESGHTNVAVGNGTLRGMGRNGVMCLSSSQCRIDNVAVAENRNSGIELAGILGHLLRGCAATRNGNHGIVAHGLIRNCHVAGNEGWGIFAASTGGNTVVQNTAIRNGSGGIRGVASTIADNTVEANEARGITASHGSTVSGNTARDNTSSGVRCIDCLALDNTSLGNGGFGIRFFGSTDAWGRNMLSDNTDGSFDGSAVALDDNACNGALC